MRCGVLRSAEAKPLRSDKQPPATLLTENPEVSARRDNIFSSWLRRDVQVVRGQEGRVVRRVEVRVAGY